MSPFSYTSRLRISFLIVLFLALFQVAGTSIANATVCTNQCVGGYVTQSYSCTTQVYWGGGYYSGGCGYPPGTYPAGTYSCSTTCTQQVWDSCASTQQVCTHPTATLTQDSATTNSQQAFTLTWGSTNASSCTVSYTGPTTGGTLSSGPTSGSQTLTPNNVGTYNATNSCTDSGGETASASVSHSVVCPAGTSWDGTSCTAPITVSLTQTKDPTASTEPFSASWTSSGATNCNITLSGPTPTTTTTNAGTSGTLQLSPQNLGTYTMSATCSSASTSTTATMTHTVNGSDLTAGSISPTTAYTASSTTFSVAISNNTAYSTIKGFTVLFQQGTTPQGGATSDVGTVSAPILAGNSSETVTFPYTFTATGIYYVRACADKSSASDTGVITETDETNNCGAWTAISAAKKGDKVVIRGTPVSITSTMGGISACTPSTSYPSLSDGVYTAWTSPASRTNGQVTSMSGVLASPGTYSFTCSNGGLTDTANLTILDCASGTTWDGNTCQSGVVTGTLTMPATCTISSPNAACPTTVSWTTQNATGPVTVVEAYSPYQTIPGGTGASGSTNMNFSPPGSYTLRLMHGTVELDRKTIVVSCVSNSNWNGNVCQTVQASAASNPTLQASPRSLNGNKSTTLTWSVTNPSSACSLSAQVVCSGGHSYCSATQLNDETRINNLLSTGTTDANDPYGPNRNIQTAVQTVAPKNNPTGTKALGTKTILMNYTTDFNLQCSTSTSTKLRVVVSDSNEG